MRLHTSTPRSIAALRVRALLAVAISTLIVSFTAPAAAFTGDARAWFGASAANLHQLNGLHHWGPGFQGGLQLGLSDFWQLSTGVEGSYHFADDDEEIPTIFVLGGFAGARYALDVFTYVPFVGLAVTGFVNGPPAAADQSGPDIGAKLTIGVDWRRSRFWSVGLLAELHTSLTQPAEFPIYSTLNINIGYHFRL